MNRLKELREERNFKMTQMAKFLGIPYTTYVGYEKSERTLHSEVLKDLSQKLGVSIDYILCRTDEKNPTTENDDGSNDLFTEIYNKFNQLPDDDREYIVSLINRLLNKED